MSTLYPHPLCAYYGYTQGGWTQELKGWNRGDGFPKGVRIIGIQRGGIPHWMSAAEGRHLQVLAAYRKTPTGWAM